MSEAYSEHGETTKIERFSKQLKIGIGVGRPYLSICWLPLFRSHFISIKQNNYDFYLFRKKKTQNGIYATKNCVFVKFKIIYLWMQNFMPSKKKTKKKPL